MSSSKFGIDPESGRRVKLRQADLLYTRGRADKLHAMLYAGHGRVVHNTTDHGVRTDRLEDVAQGEEVLRVRAGEDGRRRATVALAQIMEGTPYDLLGYNCEDFVYDMLDDDARSPQREDAFATVLKVAGVGALVWLGLKTLRSKGKPQ